MKTRLVSLALWGGLGWLRAIAATEAELAPRELELRGPESAHGILVLRKEDGRCVGEASVARMWSENPAVAAVEDGRVVPRGDGVTRILADTDAGPASAEVTVRGMGEPARWSFRNHVVPVLSRNSCNMGACHGAIAGKGGFRLSLKGYDPEADHYWITREARGRRVELAAPAQSLLLTKPTMATPHKGGRRLEPMSRDYRILAEWIASGAPGPGADADADEAALTSLEVLPERVVLARGGTQRLLVRARYADGRTEDVTGWAKFTSADETVASVDEQGRITVVGSGEGAVTVWFSSRIVLARITSPFPNETKPEQWAEAPRRGFVDDLVLAQLEELRLPVSRRTTDEEFVRRVHLDVIGMLPTAEETRAFLADPAPDKRDRLIDALLEREEYVDYWTYRWADVFLINGKLLRPEAVKAYYAWLRGKVAANASWAEIAREVVTAKGDSHTQGATNFYAVHQDPETMAENVSQAFLGLSINCARCHNHPLEKWTNDQYYAFANLFARVRAKGWGGDPRNGDGLRTLYVETSGDLMQPGKGRPQPPAPLDGEPIDPAAPEDRRERLAAWLTAGDNTLFSRAVTNRIWAAVFGRGLVDPVDDLRASNPASNEALLAALAAFLVEHDYDLKALLRVILRSETYQRSSEVLDGNRGDTKYLSRQVPRRLMAEVLHDAIVGVTGVPSSFGMIDLTDGSTQKTDLYPAGTRALELYDSAVSSYFLRTFGRNEREITCDCERSNQPSMVQVLHLSNGSTLNDKLAAAGGLVDRWITGGAADADVIEEGYLAALSRPPTARESEAFGAMLGEAPEEGRREVLEDFLWSLLTSREFLFQR
jgi:hypothetical protein